MRPLHSWRLALVLAAVMLWAACSANGGAPKTADQLAFGVSMAKRGLWSEALFRFQQARRDRPGDAEILNNIAVAYEAVGLFDEALETYQEAVRLDPGNRELKSNYSRFVEFYQAFRPREEPSESEEQGSEEEGGSSGDEGGPGDSG